jgi:hypothetical protein
MVLIVAHCAALAGVVKKSESSHVMPRLIASSRMFAIWSRDGSEFPLSQRETTDCEALAIAPNSDCVTPKRSSRMNCKGVFMATHIMRIRILVKRHYASAHLIAPIG